MLTFKWKSAKYIKNLFDLMEPFFDEATFKATQEGIYLSQMDSSRIAMIELNLPKTYMEEWNPENCFFKVDISRMKKLVLKNISLKGQVKFQVGDTVLDRRIFVTLGNGYETTFSDVLLPTKEEEFVDNVKLDMKPPCSSFRISTKLISEVFQNIDDGADKVLIKTDPLEVTLEQIHETTKTTVKLKKSELIEFDGVELRSYFSPSYLKAFMDHIGKLTDEVKVELKDDFPLKISADLALMPSLDSPSPLEIGTLVFWLAPRIELDET